MAQVTTTQAITWKVDKPHTQIEFGVKHMMFTTVRGRFNDFDATIVLDEENPNDSSVVVGLDAKSIDTAAPDRDTHLRSADFFDVENHPKLTFRSKRVEGASFEQGERFKVIGDLTIRGRTKEVELDATFEGQGRDPFGQEKAAFTAETKIDRHDFGLTWNQALETGGVLVGRDIKVTIDAQFVKPAAEEE
ncbi:MAG TPA: YceI family protein [Longimicrobiales bacterium]|nr:YceI family protein [Longimicrobiales bacterium]